MSTPERRPVESAHAARESQPGLDLDVDGHARLLPGWSRTAPARTHRPESSGPATRASGPSPDQSATLDRSDSPKREGVPSGGAFSYARRRSTGGHPPHHRGSSRPARTPCSHRRRSTDRSDAPPLRDTTPVSSLSPVCLLSCLICLLFVTYLSPRVSSSDGDAAMGLLAAADRRDNALCISRLWASRSRVGISGVMARKLR